MTITTRGRGYLVTVSHPRAPKGRIRKQYNGSFRDAQSLEASIRRGLEIYGHWPVEEGATPLQRGKRFEGTLSKATQLALDTQWKDTVWGESVGKVIWGVVRFFEERKRFNLDDINSEDIDAFVESKRSKGTSTTMIKKYFSMLSVINTVAYRRDPPMSSREKLPLPRLKSKPLEKWWLRPESLEKALEWLIEVKADPEFADYISVLVLMGYRPNEALRLSTRHFTGLGTDKPCVQVPGTKTRLSGSTIPVPEDAVDLIKRCQARAKSRGTDLLFVYTWRQASDRWNEVREFLEVSHIPTATLRSLRRTFAYYLHRRGLSTRLIQKLLRHETITTTQGYLDVVGDDDVDMARDMMNATREPEVASTAGTGELKEVIAAYKEAGASPAEIAALIKEMRT